MKNIGQKRKNRAKKVRAKTLRRRESLRATVREEHKKELLSYKSRRRQEPYERFPEIPPHPDEILRQQVGTNLDVPMSEHKVDIDRDKLRHNLETLKQMEQNGNN